MTSKIVFFGSSNFSTVVLKKLLDTGVDIVAVVTTVDKPAGRHLKLTPNPLKALALENKLVVYDDIKKFLGEASVSPDTVGLVAAYGRLIGPRTLNKLNDQIYGIHPSLLPKYRGPSPLQQQILDNVTQTGVTLYKIDLGEDTGNILAQETVATDPKDTTLHLGEKLFAKGAELFIKFLNDPNSFTPTPQDHSQATDTELFTRQDGFIEYSELMKQIKEASPELDRKFRAFYPWPGVWTVDPQGNRIKLTSTFPFKTVNVGK